MTGIPSCKALNTSLYLGQGHAYTELLPTNDSVQKGCQGRPIPVRYGTALTDCFGTKTLHWPCQNIHKAVLQRKALLLSSFFPLLLHRDQMYRNLMLIQPLPAPFSLFLTGGISQKISCVINAILSSVSQRTQINA